MLRMKAVPGTGRVKRDTAIAHRAGWMVLAVPVMASVLTAAPTAHGRNGTCEPVRVASSVEGPWRAALEALSRATSREGLPWSCPGGSVELLPDPVRDGAPAGAAGGALLTVTDRNGRSVSRRVAGPDEVVPTGEALLAAPIDDAVPAPRPSVHDGDKPQALHEGGSSAPRPPASPAEPRAQIQLTLGPRLSGPGAMAWGSARLGLQLPIGPWAIGFWARYDLHLAGPDGHWVNLETSSVSAAVSVGRRILANPFELRVTVDPSIAVVMMESGYEDRPHPEGAKPMFRLGSSVSGLFPIAGVFRGVVALDGEFAPAGITGMRNIDTHNQPPQLPPVPVYTAGILLGVEASIR